MRKMLRLMREGAHLRCMPGVNEILPQNHTATEIKAGNAVVNKELLKSAILLG